MKSVNSVNVVMAAALLVLIAWMPAAAVKYVAVVETDVDAASGASAVINPAEVREITAEFRRQATEHLPSDRYSVMTSETIQSMGGAVLEECSEENCVVALGAKIGADFIVRGTINKFGARLTLAVEMYETDNGTLVASSEAVRAQSIEELLDKGAAACANMYKKFVDKQKPAAAAVANDAGQQAGKKGKPKKEKTMASAGGEQGDSSGWKEFRGSSRISYMLSYQLPVGTPISWGGVNVGYEVNVKMREIVMNAEGEAVTKGKERRAFVALDLTFGADGDSILLGFGTRLGKEHTWENQMQIFYGVSVEFLVIMGLNGSHESDKSFLELYIPGFAPIVKYRWQFLEVSAAWLFGVRSFKEYDTYGDSNREVKFYHCPQIMVGFYYKGKTNEVISRQKIKN